MQLFLLPGLHWLHWTLCTFSWDKHSRFIRIKLSCANGVSCEFLTGNLIKHSLENILASYYNWFLFHLNCLLTSNRELKKNPTDHADGRYLQHNRCKNQGSGCSNHYVHGFQVSALQSKPWMVTPVLNSITANEEKYDIHQSSWYVIDWGVGMLKIQDTQIGYMVCCTILTRFAGLLWHALLSTTSLNAADNSDDRWQAQRLEVDLLLLAGPVVKSPGL